MAYYINDENICKIVNCREGIDLIIDYITQRSFNGNDVAVNSLHRCTIIKNKINSNINDWSNTVTIENNNKHICINPVSTRYDFENGKKVYLKDGAINYTKELYDYINFTIPAILRNNKLKKI